MQQTVMELEKENKALKYYITLWLWTNVEKVDCWLGSIKCISVVQALADVMFDCDCI